MTIFFLINTCKTDWSVLHIFVRFYLVMIETTCGSGPLLCMADYLSLRVRFTCVGHYPKSGNWCGTGMTGWSQSMVARLMCSYHGMLRVLKSNLRLVLFNRCSKQLPPT